MLDIGGRLFRPFLSDAPKRELTLREKIMGKYGSLSNAARAWGVTRSAVHNYAKGVRSVPDWVKEDLGI